MLHSGLGLDLSSPELTPSPPSSSVALVSPIVVESASILLNVTTPTRSTRSTGLNDLFGSGGAGEVDVDEPRVEEEESGDEVDRRRSRNSGTSPRKKRNDLRRPAVLDVSSSSIFA